jgi:NAD(P)H-quinone oxidoreductase subunit 5
MAGTLGLMLIAWVATSLTLHRLLLFFPGRAGAVFAARKKFVVSRLGDLNLLAALVVLYHHYGTTELSSLFNLAAAGDTAPLPGVGFLVITCAVLKSAQFPFHSWLPDTMETPTPVSALMHAGIVNAGGFLVLRLSPLMVHAPTALTLLAIVGGITAAFGAVVMLAQPSVKRALAYSTVAQMGFMLLQCGVGAFGLALLHIVAHSLYKAHAFLRAGSTIGAAPRAAIPLQTRAIWLGALGAGLLMAGGATVLRVFAPETPSTPLLFGVVVALGLAYGIARIASAGGGRATTLGGIAVVVAIAAGSFALHTAAQVMFGSFPVHHAPGLLLVALATTFIGLFAFQALLWRADQHAWGRRLHVHALNGFYIGTLANRALNRLWPRPQIA